MSMVTACPKCNSRYSLNETFVGKTIRCKKCGNPFKVNDQAATQTMQPRTQTPVKADQNRSGQFPSGREQDLFGDAASNVPVQHDPLRNHIVQDPGFADIDPERFVVKEDVKTHAPDAIIQNPALAENPAMAAAMKAEGMPVSGSQQSGMPEKTKKALNNARGWMLFIGVLMIAYNGFLLFVLNQFIADVIADMGNDLTMDKDTLLTLMYVFFISYLVIGVAFIGMAFLIHKFPLTASITGLVLYVGSQIPLFFIIGPKNALGGIIGIVIKVAVILALSQAIYAAYQHRKFANR